MAPLCVHVSVLGPYGTAPPGTCIDGNARLYMQRILMCSSEYAHLGAR